MNRPHAPHLFSMAWRTGLFVHWPFDPGDVRPHVPDPLELDTRDGRAWVSVLPFVLAGAGVRGSPSFARLRFPEVNVRTYVRFDGTPGLYFFAVDVGQSVVARAVRATTRLPVNEVDATARIRDGAVRFRSVRVRDGGPLSGRRRWPCARSSRGDSAIVGASRRGAVRGRSAAPSSADPADRTPAGRFVATYRPDGQVFHPDPGTLDHWLTERRRMYDPVGRGVLFAEVAHDPWPLQPAEATIHRNTLFEATGLPVPSADPRVSYAGRLSMTGSIPRILDS